MRISETIGAAKQLAVPIGDGVVNVTYRPADYTVEYLEGIQRRPADERLRGICEIFVRTVLTWDLQHDAPPTDVVLADYTFAEGDLVAIDVSVLAKFVPVSVMQAILEAVRKETAPDPEA